VEWSYLLLAPAAFGRADTTLLSAWGSYLIDGSVGWIVGVARGCVRVLDDVSCREKVSLYLSL
jgi:hypothetical protein